MFDEDIVKKQQIDFSKSINRARRTSITKEDTNVGDVIQIISSLDGDTLKEEKNSSENGSDTLQD